MTLTGFANAHSHAFQRSLRGRTEGDDFFAWRDLMYRVADELTVDAVRRLYLSTYREMRAAGYTVVGEFHYLGRAEALAAIDAAREAEIELVLLAGAYAHGGLARFRQPSVADYLRWVEELRSTGVRVGVAPHSIRACPPSWLVEIGRYAEREGLVLHVHADEQRREVVDCLAEHGLRPIELLHEAGCLTQRTTVVHATHADAHELDLLADCRARICVCPTTEANLGDGFLDLASVLERDVSLCIGSDSNTRIDPLEELRELEGTARRQAERRNVIDVARLLAIGTSEGAAALGVTSWPDVSINLDHRSLAGVERADLAAALVLGCASDVFDARPQHGAA